MDSSTRSEGLDSLHDRITQIHDALKDLHVKIPRIDGREPDSTDALFDTTLSNSISSHTQPSPSASLSSLPVPTSGVQGPPLAAVDPEAEEQLCSDISDRLRDIRNDYDVLVEDAQDMGWYVPTSEPSSSSRSSTRRSVGAWDDDEENDNDDINDDELVPAATLHSNKNSRNSQAAVERTRLAKSLKRIDKAITATRREFRAARTSGLARKQRALSEKVFQELETYEELSDEDSESDVSEDEYDEKHLSVASNTSRSPSPRSQQATAEASAAAELTAALRQTHARIVGEVARSDFAAQTLEESSRALAELGDRYSSSSTGVGDINSGLKAARSMVRGLLVVQKSDTWYLQMSLYILATTVAWLFFRRLLYGPLWLLVWWPVRSAFGTAMWVGKTGVSVGAGLGGAGGSSIVSVPAADVSFSSFSSVIPETSVVQAEIYATEAASSVVEEASRIIEASSTTWSTDGEASTDAPNPRKRMWEEPVEAVKHEEQLQKEKDAKAAEDNQKVEEKDTQDKGKGKEAETNRKDEL